MVSGIFAALGLASVVAAAPLNGQWHSSYAQALEAARRTGRPILVVIEGPTGASSTSPVHYANSGLDGQRLSHYVLCRIDGSTESGRRVAASFKATQFPYLAISDKACTVIRYQRSGNVESHEWSGILARFAPSQPPANPPIVIGPAEFQPPVYRWSGRSPSFGRFCPT